MHPLYKYCLRYRKHVDDAPNLYILFMREFSSVFMTPFLYRMVRKYLHRIDVLRMWSHARKRTTDVHMMGQF